MSVCPCALKAQHHRTQTAPLLWTSGPPTSRRVDSAHFPGVNISPVTTHANLRMLFPRPKPSKTKSRVVYAPAIVIADLNHISVDVHRVRHGLAHFRHAPLKRRRQAVSAATAEKQNHFRDQGVIWERRFVYGAILVRLRENSLLHFRECERRPFCRERILRERSADEKQTHQIGDVVIGSDRDAPRDDAEMARPWFQM